MHFCFLWKGSLAFPGLMQFMRTAGFHSNPFKRLHAEGRKANKNNKKKQDTAMAKPENPPPPSVHTQPSPGATCISALPTTAPLQIDQSSALLPAIPIRQISVGIHPTMRMAFTNNPSISHLLKKQSQLDTSWSPWVSEALLGGWEQP